MLVIILSLVVVLYIFLVFSCVRSYLNENRKKSQSQITETESQLEKHEKARDELYSKKLSLQSEASNIFTLYEITKDIANVLHEEEAFQVFEKKLSEHIQFIECKILKADDQNYSKFKKDNDYFTFKLDTKEKKVGFLVLKGISEDEKEKTTILVTQFLLALRRVALYQEIENIAITDSLTEVYTRRYTLDRLVEEISRSKTQKLNLAVLMLDVDHFKSINDRYGHLTGDQVLREVARIIKESLREIDIPGRFGGEEFCVILPDTDNDGAQFAAERIRSTVESTPIKAYDNTIKTHVSIGMCQFPKDGQKSSELIDKADWALYRAKKQGRNRICSFGIYEDKKEK